MDAAPPTQNLGDAVINSLEVLMRIRNNGRNILLSAFLVIAAQFWSRDQPHAQAQPVSIFVVRHSETDTSQPALSLTAAERQRVREPDRAEPLAFTELRYAEGWRTVGALSG
jgi:hypothetical protein